MQQQQLRHLLAAPADGRVQRGAARGACARVRVCARVRKVKCVWQACVCVHASGAVAALRAACVHTQ
jgi:hypothetical protein